MVGKCGNLPEIPHWRFGTSSGSAAVRLITVPWIGRRCECWLTRGLLLGALAERASRLSSSLCGEQHCPCGSVETASSTSCKSVGGQVPLVNHSPVAQLAERLTVNQDVAGSSPAGGALPIALASRRIFGSQLFTVERPGTRPLGAANPSMGAHVPRGRQTFARSVRSVRFRRCPLSVFPARALLLGWFRA